MSAERLVILSGPSGVGKGPIVEWTRKMMPELEQAYVYKSKTPRHTNNPNAGLPEPVGRPTTIYCRGSRQEIYLDSVKEAIDNNKYVLIETYYAAHDLLKSEFGKNMEVKSVFVTPISNYMANYLKKYSFDGLNECVKNTMLDSLLRRAINENKKLTKELFFNLEARADDAIYEMQFAKNYDFVLDNEMYEHMPGWKEKELSGNYLNVVTTLCDIIKGKENIYALPGEKYTL